MDRSERARYDGAAGGAAGLGGRDSSARRSDSRTRDRNDSAPRRTSATDQGNPDARPSARGSTSGHRSHAGTRRASRDSARADGRARTRHDPRGRARDQHAATPARGRARDQHAATPARGRAGDQHAATPVRGCARTHGATPARGRARDQHAATPARGRARTHGATPARGRGRRAGEVEEGRKDAENGSVAHAEAVHGGLRGERVGAQGVIATEVNRPGALEVGRGAGRGGSEANGKGRKRVVDDGALGGPRQESAHLRTSQGPDAPIVPPRARNASPMRTQGPLDRGRGELADGQEEHALVALAAEVHRADHGQGRVGGGAAAEMGAVAASDPKESLAFDAHEDPVGELGLRFPQGARAAEHLVANDVPLAAVAAFAEGVPQASAARTREGPGNRANAAAMRPRPPRAVTDGGGKAGGGRGGGRHHEVGADSEGVHAGAPVVPDHMPCRVTSHGHASHVVRPNLVAGDAAERRQSGCPAPSAREAGRAVHDGQAVSTQEGARDARRRRGTTATATSAPGTTAAPTATAPTATAPAGVAAAPPTGTSARGWGTAGAEHHAGGDGAPGALAQGGVATRAPGPAGRTQPAATLGTGGSRRTRRPEGARSPNTHEAHGGRGDAGRSGRRLRAFEGRAGRISVEVHRERLGEEGRHQTRHEDPASVGRARRHREAILEDGLTNGQVKLEAPAEEHGADGAADVVVGEQNHEQHLEDAKLFRPPPERVDNELGVHVEEIGAGGKRHLTRGGPAERSAPQERPHGERPGGEQAEEGVHVTGVRDTPRRREREGAKVAWGALDPAPRDEPPGRGDVAANRVPEAPRRVRYAVQKHPADDIGGDSVARDREETANEVDPLGPRLGPDVHRAGPARDEHGGIVVQRNNTRGNDVPQPRLKGRIRRVRRIGIVDAARRQIHIGARMHLYFSGNAEAR